MVVASKKAPDRNVSDTLRKECDGLQLAADIGPVQQLAPSEAPPLQPPVDSRVLAVSCRVHNIRYEYPLVISAT